MIHHPRILNPDEVPDEELIVYRGSELDDVRTVISRMQNGRDPSPFILYGPPGTGKTMVARYVHQEDISTETAKTAYVDCWDYYDSYHLLAQVVDQLELSVVHHDSTPKRTLVDALDQDWDGTHVVVLDELELVLDPEPLEHLAETAGLVVLGIVNDPSEIEAEVTTAWRSLDDRQYLHFNSYSVRALSTILSRRAEHGLRGNPLSDRQAERIAEAADGDARLGICILRAAARARERSTSTISTEHITAGIETARRELHQQNLERLTDHQRTLYEILREQGPLSLQDLYDVYAQRVDDDRSQKTVRKYLRKMTWYRLLERDGNTRNRVYRIDTSRYVDPALEA